MGDGGSAGGGDCAREVYHEVPGIAISSRWRSLGERTAPSGERLRLRCTTNSGLSASRAVSLTPTVSVTCGSTLGRTLGIKVDAKSRATMKRVINAVPPTFGVVYVVCKSSEDSSQGRAWDIPQICTVTCGPCGMSSLCQGCACAYAWRHACTPCEVSIARYGSITRGAESTLGWGYQQYLPLLCRQDLHRRRQRDYRRIAYRCTGRRKRTSNRHITLIRQLRRQNIRMRNIS